MRCGGHYRRFVQRVMGINDKKNLPSVQKVSPLSYQLGPELFLQSEGRYMNGLYLDNDSNNKRHSRDRERERKGASPRIPSKKEGSTSHIFALRRAARPTFLPCAPLPGSAAVDRPCGFENAPTGCYSPGHWEMERNGDVDPHAGERCFSDSEARINWSLKKETAKTRRKKKDDVVKARGGAGAMEACSSCKKSDGEGWHCKRLAHHPHSLCNYHLAKLRSYNCSHGHGKASESSKEGHGDVGRRKKKTEVAGADSSFYYYYSGFGPWRGKMRGSSSDNGEGV
ncbi:hypothetical protein BHE74_00035914 [Ensete ventricosum]|nr:hypothetical protein BHE74_00035914 [Ensete ventricosum]